MGILRTLTINIEKKKKEEMEMERRDEDFEGFENRCQDFPGARLLW